MEAVQTIQADQGVQDGLTIFSYEGIRLGKDCLIKGKPCTARAIGEWLEAKYPDKYVHKIIERNPHIRQFSKIIKLKIIDDYPKGSESTVRTREIKQAVYDPIGFQLIINKSNQPKASGFKIAIARLACDIMTGNIKIKAGKPKKKRKDKNSFIHYPEFQRAKDYLVGYPGAGGKEIQAALGIPYSTSSINRWVRYIRGEQPPSPLC